MTDEEQLIIISNNLAYLLRDTKTTQRELANAIGVSESAVGKWILAKNAPSMGNVQRIANYFGIKVSDIVENKDVETLDVTEDHSKKDHYYINKETRDIAQSIFEDKDLRLLFDAARDASPEDLQLAHNMLKALKRKERGEDDT